jgi:hypothetical protein
MIPIPGLLIYLGIAALIGYLGKDHKFGFWGHFFSAVLFTPLIGLIIVFASYKRPAPAVPAPGGPTS